SSLSSLVSTHLTCTTIFSLSLHDALPICNFLLVGRQLHCFRIINNCIQGHSSHILAIDIHGESITRRKRTATYKHMNFGIFCKRSEEHTSELQSRENLVCRLLLEKKKKQR